MKKLIIFDLDNTFYDYEKSHNHALLAVFNYQKYFLKFDDFLSEYEIHKKAVHERLKTIHLNIQNYYILKIYFTKN